MAKVTHHEMQIQKIKAHPHLVDICGVALSATEVNLYDLDGRLLCQPDVMFITHDAKMHLVEYQATNKHMRRAIQQLHTADDTLMRYHMSLMMGMHNVSSLRYAYGPRPKYKVIPR